VAGTVTLATTSIYAGGSLELSNTQTSTGLMYANAAYEDDGYALQIRGNSSLRSTTLIAKSGNFYINGATSPVTLAGTLVTHNCEVLASMTLAQLTERGAHLVSTTQTAPTYRFYALSDDKRPGLIRVENDGAAIACEVWEMPASQFGAFVAGIPAPLGIGKLELANGSGVNGFICEGIAVADAKDITQYGGWRTWLAERDK